MTHEQAIKDGWQLAPNLIHQSGAATYVKRDKHGFNTWATLDMISLESGYAVKEEQR